MLTAEQRDRLVSKMRTELGRVALAALEEEGTVELLLNPDGALWHEKLGQPMRRIGTLSASNALALIGTIATSLGQVATQDHPVIEGELLIDGSRFEGLIPPVVPSPVFAIRKKASKVFSLADYVTAGIMTEAQADCVKSAVLLRKNIVIVGGTGSGKTTFANAVINHIAETTPDDRLIIIEDTVELQVASENKVMKRTAANVSMQDLLRATMRMRPDRILVGEVRGGEALTLLKSWNTGHPGGLATVHANSAAAGLIRLEQLIAEATSTAMHDLIAEAVDFLVFIKRTETGRVVEEIVEVHGFDHAIQQYKISRFGHMAASV